MLNGKCGIFTWFGYVLPLEDKLRLIRDVGFESVMMWLGEDFDELDGDYRYIPEKADRFGLVVESAHLPYINSNDLWLDNLTGEGRYEFTLNGIMTAKEIGIDTVVIHPFDEHDDTLVANYFVKERFKRLGDIAGNNGIRLALENLDFSSPLVDIINYADNEFVGLCFDTGHNNVENKDDLYLLETFKDRLFAIHVHDNNSNRDEHILPFEGTIKWDIMREAINKTNYNRSLVLESTFPFDFSKCDQYPIDYVFVPDMPIEVYLKKAYDACQMVYSCNK